MPPQSLFPQLWALPIVNDRLKGAGAEALDLDGYRALQGKFFLFI